MLNARTADTERTDLCAYNYPRGPCLADQARPGPAGLTVRRPRVNLCTGCRCMVDEPTRIRHSCRNASRGSVQDGSSCMLDTNHGRCRVLSVCRSSDYMERTCMQKDLQITETESHQWWWKCHCKLQRSRTVVASTDSAVPFKLPHFCGSDLSLRLHELADLIGLSYSQALKLQCYAICRSIYG